jgi:hypothetical protein
MNKLILVNLLHTTGLNSLLIIDRKNWENTDLLKNYLYFGAIYLPASQFWTVMNRKIRKFAFPEFKEN